ncbi:MAG: hypothetical protein ACI9A2_003539, partial [Halioglobus sp.]
AVPTQQQFHNLASIDSSSILHWKVLILMV